MKIDIPKVAAAVVDALGQNGYEAYVVGGCVRDALLGREPNDWDITTSATPDKTLEIFSTLADFHAIPTGISHGTVTVVRDGVPVEVTTYRIDGEYSDSRHPDRVEFTEDISADLARRDFTVNAMAYSPIHGLVDPYGGAHDLEVGRICCVGAPRERFMEDALRIMRALRFGAQLGFEIEEDTAAAAEELANTLDNISKERITIELSKLLLGHDAARVVREHARILSCVLPMLDRADFVKASEYIFLLCGAPLPLMLATLLVNASEGGVREFFTRLRFDNKTAHTVISILAYKNAVLFDKPSVKRLCRDVGTGIAELIICLKRAIGETTETAEGCFDQIVGGDECYSLAQLKVNGSDILALGCEPKNVGKVLDVILDWVIAEEIPNDQQALIKTARALIIEHMP